MPSRPEPRRVAVLMGGLSTERHVSLKSGRAVAAALDRLGHTVLPIDVGPDLPARLVEARPDAAWIALHGAFGEDGCVQGLLELMRVPYTGSGVAASAAAMDKITTKRLLRDAGVRLAPDAVWRPGDPAPDLGRWPVFAKDPRGGSTIGTWRCEDAGALARALEAAASPEEGGAARVLVEAAVEGEEITVAILDGRPLPIVAIRPREGFFDFEAKYTKGATDYLVPAPLPEATAADATAQAVRAWEALGLAGLARADFIVDAEGRPWFLEVNTIPGMTPTSLSPMAAAAAGIDFDTLVQRLLDGARLHLAVAPEAAMAHPGAAPPANP